MLNLESIALEVLILNEFCLWITVRFMQRSRKRVLPHWIRLYQPPLSEEYGDVPSKGAALKTRLGGYFTKV